MITNQVQLTQMKPTAEVINGRVRIHEFDDSVQMFSFQLKNDIPWLPICDELVSRMQKFANDFQTTREIQNKQERYNLQVSLKRGLWEFAAQVEDALNAAMGIR